MHVVATAGHVDHGKSSLLRAITGMEPDRWEEERRRGLTIDLGFVWATLPTPGETTMTVAFVDVPGHHRFLGNMLAGAGAVHHALLVVAADDGWSAQSAEHLAILDLLGITGVLVAVTKADLVPADRVEAVTRETRARIAGTSLANAVVVAVDSLSGHGVADLVTRLAAVLASTSPEVDGGRPRMWIDRAFAIRGAGTVVTGTVHGGTMRVGMSVRGLPGGWSGRIRGIEALGRPVEAAPPGSRAALNLAGVSHTDVVRGEALVDGAADQWTCTSTVDVSLRSIIDAPLDQAGAWHVHVGTAETAARLWPLLGPIAPLGTDFARLELDTPLPLVHGDRLVLRDAGRDATVAGASVLLPDPGRRPKGIPGRLAHADRLERILTAQGPGLAAAVIEAQGGALPRSRLVALTNRTWDSTPGLVEVGEYLVLADRVEQWRDTARTDVARAMLGAGRRTADVLTTMQAAGCPPPVARGLLDQLVRMEVVRRHGDELVAPAHDALFLKARTTRLATAVEEMTRNLFEPPDLDDVIHRLQLRPSEVQTLFDRGDLVRAGERVFAGTAIPVATERLREAFGDAAFTASDARAALGTTRRFALPLLEHLSQRGVTVFEDGVHRLEPR
jgi:selenocysteine-specific elongation factor